VTVQIVHDTNVQLGKLATMNKTINTITVYKCLFSLQQMWAAETKHHSHPCTLLHANSICLHPTR